MSNAVEEALSKARAGKGKASAKDAAPAQEKPAVPVAPLTKEEAPAPVETASSAQPAHELDVIKPVEAIIADAAPRVMTEEVIRQIAEDAAAFAEALGAKSKDERLGEGNVEDANALTEIESFESESEHDPSYIASHVGDDPVEAGDEFRIPYGKFVHNDIIRLEAVEVTASAGDVHPAYAALPPVGTRSPVFKG